MKKTLLTAVLFLAALFCAQAESHVSVKSELKASYNFDKGFKGDRISIRLNGSIDDKFSYAVFQNFNRQITKENPLAATDWAYVSWQPDEHWSLTAGKQMTYMGGIEYDHRAIDLIYATEWWYGVNCFLLGVTGKYLYNEGNGTLAFEVSQSPYALSGENYYGFNLYWNGGRMGCWTPIWSTNLFQYSKNGFVHYLILGNKFTFGPVSAELDFLHGGDLGNYSLLNDWSAVLYGRWDISKMVSVFTKLSYEKTPANASYLPIAGLGTDAYKLGGGVEFFPIPDVRLHAAYHRLNNTNVGTIGVSWFFTIYKK